jgi:hypothetical protein
VDVNPGKMMRRMKMREMRKGMRVQIQMDDESKAKVDEKGVVVKNVAKWEAIDGKCVVVDQWVVDEARQEWAVVHQ